FSIGAKVGLALEVEVAWLTDRSEPRELQRLVIGSEFDRKVSLHATILNEPASKTGRSESAQKIDDLALGPAAVITVGRGEKGAVAAIVGFVEGDVGVGRDQGQRLWGDGKKRSDGRGEE